MSTSKPCKTLLAGGIMLLQVIAASAAQASPAGSHGDALSRSVLDHVTARGLGDPAQAAAAYALALSQTTALDSLRAFPEKVLDLNSQTFKALSDVLTLGDLTGKLPDIVRSVTQSGSNTMALTNRNEGTFSQITQTGAIDRARAGVIMQSGGFGPPESSLTATNLVMGLIPAR